MKDLRITDEEHRLLEGWKVMVAEARQVFELAGQTLPDDEVLAVHMVQVAARKRIGMANKKKDDRSLEVMREGYKRIEAVRAKLAAS